ncbi:hypothetical protein JYU34_020796 [Plutella xylostella]|uniref:Uncharacterized protein n=1 Tax=Plutella xylostella TaxID=51655 RepID=A0ABQ7PRY0_PLUXY|nr:hypothetical protein JYU34_020796 [Plutella xylostella]
MGAKASTAGGGAGERPRTFSTSSSSEVVAGGGFSLLRALPGLLPAPDRQRARSLSSVPDLPGPAAAPAAAAADSDSEPDDAAPRVLAAHSLPSHIWSINVLYPMTDP